MGRTAAIGDGSPAERTPARTTATTGLSALRRELQELGLSPYEAGVLLALLRLGSANTLDLSRASEVPRTSTYQILEDLKSKRLAQRLPGNGPAVWTCPGGDEVLERLDAAQEEQLRRHRDRADLVRGSLRELVPERPAVPLPDVHLIFGAAQAKTTYERLLAEARSELLVFNRPPYSWNPGQVNPAVQALDPNVKTRALYQAAQLEDEAFRKAIEAYHHVGVEGRVVTGELPVKLAVADRKEALITMTSPVPIEVGFPTVLHIENPGFAALQAEAFDHRWATAVPYDVHLSDHGLARSSRRPSRATTRR